LVGVPAKKKIFVQGHPCHRFQNIKQLYSRFRRTRRLPPQPHTRGKNKGQCRWRNRRAGEAVGRGTENRKNGHTARERDHLERHQKKNECRIDSKTQRRWHIKRKKNAPRLAKRVRARDSDCGHRKNTEGSQLKEAKKVRKKGERGVTTSRGRTPFFKSSMESKRNNPQKEGKR